MTKNARPYLVTGANGFIGRRLCDHLERSGSFVVPWTRSLVDLTAITKVSSTMRSTNPRTIFHLAASPPVSAKSDWQYAAAETTMFNNLLETCPIDCTIVVAGSMAEFGRGGVFAETDICTPNSQYGFAKNGLVNAAVAARYVLGRDVRVARLFGVYGPGEGHARLVPYVVKKLMAGQPAIIGSGEQLRDFIHVDDVCRILIELSAPTHANLDLVHVGTGRGALLRDVCETVASTLGADHKLLRFGEKQARDIDQNILVANTNKLAQLTKVPDQHWPSGALAIAYVKSLSELYSS